MSSPVRKTGRRPLSAKQVVTSRYISQQTWDQHLPQPDRDALKEKANQIVKQKLSNLYEHSDPMQFPFIFREAFKEIFAEVVLECGYQAAAQFENLKKAINTAKEPYYTIESYLRGNFKQSFSPHREFYYMTNRPSSLWRKKPTKKDAIKDYCERLETIYRRLVQHQLAGNTTDFPLKDELQSLTDYMENTYENIGWTFKWSAYMTMFNTEEEAVKK